MEQVSLTCSQPWRDVENGSTGQVGNEIISDLASMDTTKMNTPWKVQSRKSDSKITDWQQLNLLENESSNGK